MLILEDVLRGVTLTLFLLSIRTTGKFTGNGTNDSTKSYTLLIARVESTLILLKTGIKGKSVSWIFMCTYTAVFVADI